MVKNALYNLLIAGKYHTSPRIQSFKLVNWSRISFLKIIDVHQVESRSLEPIRHPDSDLAIDT